MGFPRKKEKRYKRGERMRKKLIIGLLILIFTLGTVYIAERSLKSGKSIERIAMPVDYVKETESVEEPDNGEEQEKIKEMINNQGIEANANIYEIGTEYDGREVLVLKPEIQYQVALAGLLKKGKPEPSELDEILEKAPKHTGIWVEEDSRTGVLKILKKITNGDYEIDEEGFLIQKENWRKNKYDKKIEKILSESKLYIIAIKSTTYLVDEVTGEIQEYPFEEMDPYDEYEYFESNEKKMFIISENEKGKINQEEVFKNILEFD